MANQAYPSIGDDEPSWADIAVTGSVFDGPVIDMADIAAIKFGDKVEVGVRKGTSGGRVMGRTAGEGSQEASATMYRSGHRKLVKALMTKGRTRGNQIAIGGVKFDIFVQWTPFGETEIYQVKIVGCRMLGRSFDAKEGTDPDKVELILNPMQIIEVIDGQEVVLL